MSAETIHIAGRYNKYLRNLSQSPWIDKDDVRVKDSVQELIEDGLKEYLGYDKSTFTSSGREDVDVRMLGRGRPFVFKIHNPRDIDRYIPETLKKIQNFVNTKHKGKVHIRDLQIVSKVDTSKFMNDGQENKQKEYRALCCCSRRLTTDDVEKIGSIKELVLEQMTPIRVLHRRTWATRERTIHRMRIESVQPGDFDCAREKDLDRIFALVMTTEAGTYIKEFVHGDFGRTEPNLAGLLGGGCETDLMELDVMEVYSDWPPSIPDGDVENTATQKIAPLGADDKMDTSTEELAALYEKAVGLMRDAETKPRGDHRQDLYIQARRLFKRTMDIVESLNLFSDNETIEDIATVDLKYLLIRAHLAKITLSAECSPNRLETFSEAERHIRGFLRLICDYNLANEAVERALGKSDDESSDLGQIHTTSRSTSLEDAMRERNERIERLKKSKQLETRLEELEERVKCQQVDDEIVREYYTNLIKKTTDDMLETLEREVKPAIFFERSRSSAIDTEIQSTSKPKFGKPITIVKDALQKHVFGIGYPSKPTVTVDEFITKKITDGDLIFEQHKEIYANSLQRYAERPNLRKEQEEMSDEEREAKEDRHDDDELQRKRRWDAFKDENPRGSGNRHNMG